MFKNISIINNIKDIQIINDTKTSFENNKLKMAEKCSQCDSRFLGSITFCWEFVDLNPQKKRHTFFSLASTISHLDMRSTHEVFHLS